MPLPDPGTRSPGKLVIYYTAQGVEHQASAWFKESEDFSDIAAIRVEAEAFAEALMDMSANSSAAHDWAILAPDGVTMYTEPFGSAITGAHAIGTGDVATQSFSLSAIGKGVPPTIGLGFGNTRTFIYPGYYRPGDWGNALVTPITTGYVAALRNYLDSSLKVGADFYGQGAEYGVNYNAQVNAHHQKEFGI